MRIWILSIIIICLGGIWYVNKTYQAHTATITIGLAGDTMLGRLVNEKLQQDPLFNIWGDTLSLLHQQDINLVNLECVLTTHNTAVPKVFNFKADPAHVNTLVKANIHLVNLANNHSLDFEQKGLLDTISTLEKAKIAHVGAGTDIAHARRPIIIERNGIRCGFLGYTDNEPPWLATESTPGTNYISIEPIKEHDAIAHDIRTLKEQVNLVIVSIHWGPNMRLRPSKTFQDFAHQLIDLGVDIIHGHSAHVLQGIEIYHNRVILYDTGDFIDDYRIDEQLRNDWSALFQITVNQYNRKTSIATIQIHPLIIKNLQVNRARGDDQKAILQRLRLLCGEFGTEIDNGGTIHISD